MKLPNEERKQIYYLKWETKIVKFVFVFSGHFFSVSPIECIYSDNILVVSFSHSHNIVPFTLRSYAENNYTVIFVTDARFEIIDFWKYKNM